MLAFFDIMIVFILIVIYTSLWIWKLLKKYIPLIDKKCTIQIKIPWLIHVEKGKNTLHWAIYSERKFWYSAAWEANDRECYDPLRRGLFPKIMNFKFLEGGWTDIDINNVTALQDKKDSFKKLTIVVLNGEEMCRCRNSKAGVYPIQGLICTIWLGHSSKPSIVASQKYLLLNDLTVVTLKNNPSGCRNICSKCIISPADYLQLHGQRVCSLCNFFKICAICKRKFDLRNLKIMTPSHKTDVTKNNTLTYLSTKHLVKDYNNNNFNK